MKTAMLRQRLTQQTPTRQNSNSYNFLNKLWKLALIGLVVSVIVISAKIGLENWEGIKEALLERRLVTFEVFTEKGDLMFKHTWKRAVKYSNIWLPLLCGFLTTYFTWIIVYLDSHMPGVQPPSPFSPNKYKARSGHSFHLNYVFAIVIGVLVTFYMYWRNVSLIF